MPTSESRRDQIIRFVQERQTTLASGLAALLIIVVGFLIFNFFLNVNKDTTPQDEQTTSEESTNSADIALTTTPSTTPTPEKSSNTGEVSPEGGAKVTENQEYTIARGDTLGTIAQKFYGDSKKWSDIAKANNLSDPNRIHPGNKLMIPKSESGTVASSTTIKETPATGIGSGGDVEYVVTQGDTLWQIADKFYGSGFEWYRLRDANPNLVSTLSNGRPLITPGQHLLIP
jgi:nucleoid-associated protein YgaU